LNNLILTFLERGQVAIIRKIFPWPFKQAKTWSLTPVTIFDLYHTLAAPGVDCILCQKIVFCHKCSPNSIISIHSKANRGSGTFRIFTHTHARTFSKLSIEKNSNKVKEYFLNAMFKIMFLYIIFFVLYKIMLFKLYTKKDGKINVFEIFHILCSNVLRQIYTHARTHARTHKRMYWKILYILYKNYIFFILINLKNMRNMSFAFRYCFINFI